jgi:hypothetical protein
VKIVPFHIGVEGVVNVLGGDIAERKRAAGAGIGEDNVESFALGLHRRVESIEVGFIRNRAPYRAGIGPELSHSGVERFLPAAEDEYERTLGDEALCCGAADTGSAAGDHSGLSIQSGHVVYPSLELYENRELLSLMGYMGSVSWNLVPNLVPSPALD